MTFEEAILKSLRTYWNNTRDFDSLKTSQDENRKYTKKYFDSIENEFIPKNKIKDKKVAQ